MKIEQQLRDDHQVTLTVEVEPERFESAKRRAARKLSRKTKIPGFRPGKAPYDVIRSFLGEGAIVEEAVEILIDEVYPEALKEADIEPAASGALEDIASLDPPTFVFVVPLRPEVDLGDYESIRLEYDFTPPTEEDVDQAIDELRRMFAQTQEVERPIKDGDYVLAAVSIFPTEADGEEEAVALEARESFAFVAHDEPADDEWPFAGFSSNVIGMKPGENRSVLHTFSEEAEEEALRGKATRIEIQVKAVRSLEVPEANDEFARMAGAETMDELRKTMRTSLTSQAQEEYDDEFYARVLDAIKEQASIKYPPQLVEDEIENVLRDLEVRLQSQGIDLDAYLESQQKSREEFIAEEIRPTAVQRLERGLILDEIARRANVEFDDDDLEAEFQSLLTEMQLSGRVDFSKLRSKRDRKEFAEYLTYQAVRRLVTGLVLDHLKKVVTGAAEEEDEAASESAPVQEEGEETAPEEAVDEAAEAAAEMEGAEETKKAAE